MDLSRFTNVKKYLRNGQEYQLFFDFDLKELTGHNRKTFDDFQSLLYFLQNNIGKKILITQVLVDESYEDGESLVININAYQAFCKKIGQNGKNRTQAFLAQKIKHYTEDDKKRIIGDSTEEEILERIKNFTIEQKNTFFQGLGKIEGIDLPHGQAGSISDEEFLQIFPNFLNDLSKQKVIFSSYPQIQIKILEQYKEFLKEHLNQDETFIQNWIDGKIDDDGVATNSTGDERKKTAKSRCLIFGLEFISHKREGEIGSKQFDILTRISQGENNYVLIELKSPNKDVFATKTRLNQNGGQVVDYSLSDDVSRAIPQISDYRSLLDRGGEAEWQKIGLPTGKISKCLIVIGVKKNDPVWQEHFLSLKRNLSGTIEILTYTDLIQKIETTIENLKDNL